MYDFVEQYDYFRKELTFVFKKWTPKPIWYVAKTATTHNSKAD